MGAKNAQGVHFMVISDDEEKLAEFLKQLAWNCTLS
jgi:hypothetical protein